MKSQSSAAFLVSRLHSFLSCPWITLVLKALHSLTAFLPVVSPFKSRDISDLRQTRQERATEKTWSAGGKHSLRQRYAGVLRRMRRDDEGRCVWEEEKLRRKVRFGTQEKMHVKCPDERKWRQKKRGKMERDGAVKWKNDNVFERGEKWESRAEEKH